MQIDTPIQMSMTAFGDLILEHLCVPQLGQRSKQTSRENMETSNASRNKGPGRKNNLELSPAEMSALNWETQTGLAKIGTHTVFFVIFIPLWFYF